MKTIKTISVAALSLSLLACGGGGGGGGGGNNTNPPPSPPPPPPPPVADQAIGGIYNGRITGGCGQCPFDVFVIISEDGEYLTQDLEFLTRANAGKVDVTGGDFTGTRNLYGFNFGVTPFGHIPTAPSPADNDNANRSIEGRVTERSSISADYMHNGNHSVDMDLTYDTQYERASSLATIAGTYSVDDGAGFTLTYVIDNTGEINGSDTTGCTVSGNVEIIDAAYNMYRTDLSFAACGANGADGAGYTGLATLRTDPTTMAESLYFYAATDREIVILDLPRL